MSLVRTEFNEKYEKPLRRDIMIMALSLILAIGLCSHQLYLKHLGSALILAFIGLVISIMLMIYYSAYSRTKKLFEQSDKMIDEILDQLEKDGRL